MPIDNDLEMFTMCMDMDDSDLHTYRREPQVWVTTALRRKKVEVSLKKCTAEEVGKFTVAKSAELKQWMITEAVRRAKREGIPPSSLMRMRWLLTWKDGGTRAKARLVVLGFTDPHLLDLRTDAPTCSRRGKHLFLLKTAQLGFKLEKGDISSAFLQSGNTQEAREVFAEPVPELTELMQLGKDEVVQILNATYGLTVAPREFYLHFAKTMESIGAQEMKAEPCLYVVREGPKIVGMVSQYVDDVMVSGDVNNATFQKVQRDFRAAYRWGGWESEKFVQCGVEINQVGDTITLCQHQYGLNLETMEVHKARKNNPEAPLTERERSQLRGICGAGQWIGTQSPLGTGESFSPSRSSSDGYRQRHRGGKQDRQGHPRALRHTHHLPEA